MENWKSSITRLALHPATTILFALIGVVVGVLAITRSVNEKQSDSVATRTFEKMIAEVQREQSSLRDELKLLQSNNANLRKEISDLRSEIAEIKLPKQTPQKPRNPK